MYREGECKYQNNNHSGVNEETPNTFRLTRLLFIYFYNCLFPLFSSRISPRLAQRLFFPLREGRLLEWW